jgi:hypothetical protein
MHLGRQVFDQKGESLANRSGLDHVVIVKHENETLA